MNRWVKVDCRYNQPYRLTGYAIGAIFKWVGLIFAWIIANIIVTSVHLGLLVFATTGGLIWYGVHCARRGRPQLTQQTYQSVPPVAAAMTRWQFNPPPNWPPPPASWSPPPGWQPDPSWPPAPPGWQLWIQVPPPRGATGERNSRIIPQDVKIAVSVRDQGMCVQCGSREDLHYDHKIPWSKGGSNTVNNIQLLCGCCNRAKGADDIPF
jgi:5-methylcytosine-specific restriction endonuclease McrA